VTTVGQSERIAAEQAALRRVATLVAREAPPEDVFDAVAAEVGRLLEVEFTLMSRYDSDGAATIVGAWSSTSGAVPAPVGSRDLHTMVFQARRPARIDDYAEASSTAAAIAGDTHVRSAVGVPIIVTGTRPTGPAADLLALASRTRAAER
jgi:GAF domain-containing protein